MSETLEQIRVCDFIRAAYPDVKFYSALCGLKLPPHLARLVKLLRSGNGFTDLFIFKPNEKYHGLFIELKDNTVNIYKKNGTLKKDQHLQEQQEMINSLNQDGYYACFAIGESQAIQVINDYMNNKL